MRSRRASNERICHSSSTEPISRFKESLSSALSFSNTWRSQRLTLLALADDPVSAVYSADYHSRHHLPANPTLQTALKTLLTKELVGRDDDGVYRIVEPFFAEWLVREQRGYGVPPEVRGELA